MGRSPYWPTIESCRRLATRDIGNKALFHDGAEWDISMAWPSGFTVKGECRLIRGQPDSRTFRISYPVGEDGGLAEDTFTLQRYAQPFGGYRWYFICPSSNRRCTVIYQPPGAIRFRSRWGFRCRLQYQSQRLAPMSRYQHGAAQTAKRVLAKGPPEWQAEYEEWDFPPKPPWMRMRTYNRLDEKAQAYDEAVEAEFEKRIARMGYLGEDDLMKRLFA